MSDEGTDEKREGRKPSGDDLSPRVASYDAATSRYEVADRTLVYNLHLSVLLVSILIGLVEQWISEESVKYIVGLLGGLLLTLLYVNSMVLERVKQIVRDAMVEFERSELNDSHLRWQHRIDKQIHTAEARSTGLFGPIIESGFLKRVLSESFRKAASRFVPTAWPAVQLIILLLWITYTFVALF